MKFCKKQERIISKGKLYEGMKAYFEHEDKTDLFVIEKFRLKKEIKAMKYALEKKGINVRFELHMD